MYTECGNQNTPIRFRKFSFAFCFTFVTLFHRKTIEDVISLAEQELICPHVSKEFDLEDVNDALKYLEDAKCTGKVVLDLD